MSTIANPNKQEAVEGGVSAELAAKRIEIIRSGKYTYPTGRTAKEVDEWLRQLRENDRL